MHDIITLLAYIGFGLLLVMTILDFAIYSLTLGLSYKFSKELKTRFTFRAFHSKNIIKLMIFCVVSIVIGIIVTPLAPFVNLILGDLGMTVFLLLLIFLVMYLSSYFYIFKYINKQSLKLKMSLFMALTCLIVLLVNDVIFVMAYL